jgi:hypothetical protein
MLINPIRIRRYDMAGKLMEYFNKQPRIGVISTSSKDGKVDSAVIGSPQMIDEKTVIVALGKGRTFANLQENPNAVYIIIEPAEELLKWKGIRVYLRMKEHASSGQKFEIYKREVAEILGKKAADMIKVLATFEVTEVRPLIDLGQSWEGSI